MTTRIDFEQVQDVLEMMKDVCEGEMNCFCFHREGIQKHSREMYQNWTSSRQDKQRIVYLLVMKDGGGIMPPLVDNNNSQQQRAETVECPDFIKAAILLICDKFATTIYDPRKVKASTETTTNSDEKQALTVSFTRIVGGPEDDQGNAVPDCFMPTNSNKTDDSHGRGASISCFFSMPTPLTASGKEIDRNRRRALRIVKSLEYDGVALDVSIELRRTDTTQEKGCVVHMTHDEVLAIRREVAEYQSLEREKMLAFCMIFHPRLAKNNKSTWTREIPGELVRIIGRQGALVWQDR
jgi:hypothetical protein